MVFQDYSRSLFPWLRVRQNVEYPLKRLAKAERAQQATDALDQCLPGTLAQLRANMTRSSISLSSAARNAAR